MYNKTVVQALADAVGARLNCIQSANQIWLNKHEETIWSIVKNCLPSGSRIDSGCSINLAKSTRDKLVIDCEFHHTNENGFYEGTTGHVVTVTPAFDGIYIVISGQNRNDIKEYLTETFDQALNEICTIE